MAIRRLACFSLMVSVPRGHTRNFLEVHYSGLWIKMLVAVFKMGQIPHSSAYTLPAKAYLISLSIEMSNNMSIGGTFSKVSVIDTASAHLGCPILPRQTEN